jgi:hypothetical protein
VASFYASLHGSEYSQAEEAAKALDTLVQNDPTAADASIVRGLAHLWHIAEFARDPSQDPSTILPEAIQLLPAFQAAQQNNPDDRRVNCWLGLTMINAGRQTSNQDLIDQGTAVLEQGVTDYPEFNLFCRALAYADQPASDPDFTRAVEALWQTSVACFGQELDRQNPDPVPGSGHLGGTQARLLERRHRPARGRGLLALLRRPPGQAGPGGDGAPDVPERQAHPRIFQLALQGAARGSAGGRSRCQGRPVCRR